MYRVKNSYNRRMAIPKRLVRKLVQGRADRLCYRGYRRSHSAVLRAPLEKCGRRSRFVCGCRRLLVNTSKFCNSSPPQFDGSDELQNLDVFTRSLRQPHTNLDRRPHKAPREYIQILQFVTAAVRWKCAPKTARFCTTSESY